MTSRLRIRSKEEKRLIDAGHALLDDPNATPADKLRAMGYLERAIRLAEKRRIRREDADWYPEPEPTVADLVSALESKKPLLDANSDALEAPGSRAALAKGSGGHPNRDGARAP